MRYLYIAFFLLASPLFSYAQFSADGMLGTNLSIQSMPEYPSPGEAFELSIDDYGGGAYGAEILWYRNDTLIPNTANARKITLTAGDVGVKEVISVVFKKSNGVTNTLKKEFTPMFLDIIVEPQTHVPGFYQGRALASVGSTVNLTALLSDGETLIKRDLVYLWKYNLTVIEGGPLRNRNEVSFKMPQDSYTVVSVQVSTPSGEILAKESTIIPLATPEVHFYEVNALYGVELKTITGDFNMIADSATIVAEPYFIDSNTFNYPDILEWKINNSAARSNSSNPYIITLQKTGDPGAATLDFHVRNTDILLQGAKNQIKINI
ncbi:MAG: hypothetical protein RL538_169 [Candidatus Parcubacteria bacterium]